MGRPLKTTKASGTVDTGYNNYPPGVTGGNTGQTGNQVLARVKIGTQTEANGYIIRQKGKNKFLVGSVTAIQDEDIAADVSYIITDTSNTDWTYFGLTNAANGQIFTSSVSGAGLTTNGVVNRVGVCTLADIANASLTANTMTVTCTYANASTFKAATLSNHFVTDFTTPLANKYLAAYAADGATSPITVNVAHS
jgi:hypothetical protein